jgi:hypothetical protein
MVNTSRSVCVCNQTTSHMTMHAKSMYTTPIASAKLNQIIFSARQLLRHCTHMHQQEPLHIAHTSMKHIRTKPPNIVVSSASL